MTNKEGAGGPDPNPAKDDSAKRNNTSQIERLLNEGPSRLEKFIQSNQSDLSPEVISYLRKRIQEKMGECDPKNR